MAEYIDSKTESPSETDFFNKFQTASPSDIIFKSNKVSPIETEAFKSNKSNKCFKSNKVSPEVFGGFERIQTLISNYKIKLERIEIDTVLRDSYTNKSLTENYYKINGRDSPPLLLRQYNTHEDKNETDLKEAKNNIKVEFNNQLELLCTFTKDEIVDIIRNNRNSLSTNNEYNYDNLPIYCNVNGIQYILKYYESEDINGFFLTRFIIEDNIIPLFENIIFDFDKALKGKPICLNCDSL